jgi:hypothetical protein
MITGTFLDEISHDIPHQNWGEMEWERDFQAMAAIGIKRVILIRSGHRKWMTYPSEVLKKAEGGYMPPVDLVDMFLRLAEKYQMEFYFGMYDSGRPHWHDDYQVEPETDLMRAVVDEAWQKYGHCPSFKGWYLSAEISGRSKVVPSYRKLGKHCKAISGNLPIMISPGMSGPKALGEDLNPIANPITLKQHEKEWNENMAQISGIVDIVAFQDGHLDYEQLPDFLAVNKALCDKYNIQCWSNVESFDRDMPIRFLPIKFEKLLLKMNAAQKAGIKEFITFEFSHFMSPNSCYKQAKGLYNRYREHFNV